MSDQDVDAPLSRDDIKPAVQVLLQSLDKASLQALSHSVCARFTESSHIRVRLARIMYVHMLVLSADRESGVRSWSQFQIEYMHVASKVCKALEVSPPEDKQFKLLQKFFTGTQSKLRSQEHYFLQFCYLIVGVAGRGVEEHPWICSEDRELLRLIEPVSRKIRDGHVGIEDLRALVAGLDRWCGPNDHGPSVNSRVAIAAPGGGHEHSDSLVMTQFVDGFFDCPAHRRKALDSLFESVAIKKPGSQVDGGGSVRHAHFVIYRPRQSNPSQLVKSFLVVIPPGPLPEANGMADRYIFTHFYPDLVDSGVLRKTTGVVLPMDQGLYFLGGQEDSQTPTSSDAPPYKALKVIGVEWNPVEARGLVIPVVCMSTSMHPHIFVSRAAMIRTCLSHTNDAGIGLVDVDSLEEDLRRVLEKEKLVPDRPTYFNAPHSRSADTLAARIRQNSNNAPCAFSLSGTWFLDEGDVPVVAAEIEAEVERVLRRFTNEKGLALSLQDLRYGALAVDSSTRKR